MIVSQKMVAEAEIICQQRIPLLDVKKYHHLCAAQEQSVQVDVSSTSPSESMSTETCRFEPVCFFSWLYYLFLTLGLCLNLPEIGL